MAGPRPDDNYNPNTTISPSGPPSDYLNVRANPNEFGAQVGQAYQGLGKTLEGAGQDAMNVAIQAQGLANEHAANIAEMQLAVDGGDVYNKYKSLEGLDAVNSRQKAIQDYLSINQKIRDGLGNPAAQRAYDALATRRMAFTIQDMNSYAANEQKKAYRQGNEASRKLSIESAARPEIASDPRQLNDAKANIIFQTNTEFTAPGYGLFQTVPVTQGKDGRLQFDTSTDQGRIAQANYNNALEQDLGQMYENAATIIATDPKNPNIAKAVDFLEANKNNMSAITYARISNKLSGPYRNEQSRSIAEAGLSEAMSAYNNSAGNVHGPVYTTNLGNVTDSKTGLFQNPTTPVDGATLAANNLRSEIYHGKTLIQIAQTWTGEPQKAAAWADTVSKLSGVGVNDVPTLNNPVVVKQLLRGIAAAEKSPDDRRAFNDSVIEKGVNNSFSGLQANLSQGRNVTLNGNIHQSYADYLGDHEAELIQGARDRAKAAGFDVIGQDMAAERIKTRIAEYRSAQAGEIHSLKNSLLSKIMDPDHPITNMATLDYGDPEIKAAWIRLQSLDSFGANALQRIVNANAQGRSNTYGTEFYKHFSDVLTGKVSDLAQLQDYFGGDKSPISSSGVRVLQQTMEDMQTPQGQGFRRAEASFLNMAQGKITGSSVFPGINPAVLGGKFDKYLQTTVPQIEAKRQDMIKQGKDPSMMFNPESPDYIGKNIVAPSQGEITKAMSSSIFSGQSFTPSNATSVPNPHPENPGATLISYKSPEDVGLAYQNGKITKDQARELINSRFGGFAPKVPVVH